VFTEVLQLPIRTPKRGATIAYVQKRLAENHALPLLTKALARAGSATPKREFQEIVGELYDAAERNRYGLKLLDRTAKDQPKLAALWFEGARGGLLAALSEISQTRDGGRDDKRGPRRCSWRTVRYENGDLWRVPVLGPASANR
jgi:hypothetical protein